MMVSPQTDSTEETQPTSKAFHPNSTSATEAATKTKPASSTQWHGARPANDQVTARSAPGTNKTTLDRNTQCACGQRRGKSQSKAAVVGATATAPLDQRDMDGPAQLSLSPVFCLGAVRWPYTGPQRGGRGKPRSHREKFYSGQPPALGTVSDA